MKTPFLDFYNMCIEDGKIFKLINMFSRNTAVWGTSWYWGYTGDLYEWVGADPKKQDKIMYTFTPMRQSIILLCAAINGEL